MEVNLSMTSCGNSKLSLKGGSTLIITKLTLLWILILTQGAYSTNFERQAWLTLLGVLNCEQTYLNCVFLNGVCLRLFFVFEATTNLNFFFAVESVCAVTFCIWSHKIFALMFCLKWLGFKRSQTVCVTKRQGNVPMSYHMSPKNKLTTCFQDLNWRYR